MLSNRHENGGCDNAHETKGGDQKADGEGQFFHADPFAPPDGLRLDGERTPQVLTRVFPGAS